MPLHISFNDSIIEFVQVALSQIGNKINDKDFIWEKNVARWINIENEIWNTKVIRRFGIV